MPMHTCGLLAIVAFFFFQATPGCAQSSSSPAISSALSGRVSSVEEGPMEGVLVSVKRAGSTMTITVVSDQQGRYRFPASKLAPGQYALSIRAVGYDLGDPSTVEVAAGKSAIADLKLRPASDVAAQLSNAEWLASIPGTEQQKASIRNCNHCHTLERVMRSRADEDGLAKIVERMSTYPQLSFPLMPQKLVAARIGGGEDPLEQKQEGWRRQARYLSTVNLLR
jgi:virginiamycin B lyase